MDTRGLAILKEIRSSIYIDEQAKPSDIIKTVWGHYTSNYHEDNSINGAVFEELLGYIFTIKRCTPFYMQAKVAYVPNVNYDFILFDKEDGPVSISAKTTLRERWKQADLEAVALKYVHRNALSYLITLDQTAVVTRKNKLADCMALNDFILADGSEFDDLITVLQQRNLDLAGTVDVIQSNRIISQDSGELRYGIQVPQLK
jgi:hypothetical protein